MTNDRFHKSISFVICHLLLFLYICNVLTRHKWNQIKTTLNAMKEIEAMKKDKNTKFFNSTKEILIALKS